VDALYNSQPDESYRMHLRCSRQIHLSAESSCTADLSVLNDINAVGIFRGLRGWLMPLFASVVCMDSSNGIGPFQSYFSFYRGETVHIRYEGHA
jgi:hypothetical protein